MRKHIGYLVFADGKLDGNMRMAIKNRRPEFQVTGFLVLQQVLVEAGGIEPPSASPLQAVLHT